MFVVSFQQKVSSKDFALQPSYREKMFSVQKKKSVNACHTVIILSMAQTGVSKQCKPRSDAAECSI